MPPDQPLLERQPSAPTEAEVVIRALRAGDLEGLNALQNLPGFRFGTLRMPYTSLDETRKFFESRSPGHLGLVAEAEGVIVGTAGLDRFTGRRQHVGAIGMGVHDAYVGRGIGTRLLRALLDAADNWLALRRVELTVFVDNAPAIALYERHGFAVEGTLRSYAFRDGAYEDAYAMARLRP
ncbi:MAG TPA: GNAT family N-acetyltransferase [Microvirga sp.]|jgi:putative acetyltransferase|nr:GNAT family N-acetyltransferase [Microvirga sp.]